MAPGPGRSSCAVRQCSLLAPRGSHLPAGDTGPVTAASVRLAPVLGAVHLTDTTGVPTGMQVMVALLDVVTFMAVLLVLAGMAGVPWLVDGAR